MPTLAAARDGMAPEQGPQGVVERFGESRCGDNHGLSWGVARRGYAQFMAVDVDNRCAKIIFGAQVAW